MMASNYRSQLEMVHELGQERQERNTAGQLEEERVARESTTGAEEQSGVKNQKKGMAGWCAVRSASRQGVGDAGGSGGKGYRVNNCRCVRAGDGGSKTMRKN
jgi:hypothetical protein